MDRYDYESKSERERKGCFCEREVKKKGWTRTRRDGHLSLYTLSEDM